MERFAREIEEIKQLTRAQKYEEALSLCNKTLQDFPQMAELYYQKALILWNKSEVVDLPQQEFFDLLKKASELDPSQSEPHKLCGYAHQLLGNPARADAAYTRAIEANPQDLAAYSYRGELRLLCGMYPEAVEDLTKIIDTGHSGPRAYAFRADAKYALKDYEGALADYAKGIELNPHYGGGYFGKGRCKYALQDYTGAVEEYSCAINLFPQETSLYACRGDAYIKLNNNLLALADFQKILELNPQDKTALRAVADLQPNVLAGLPEGVSFLEVILPTGYKASIAELPNGEKVTLLHLSEQVNPAAENE